MGQAAQNVAALNQLLLSKIFYHPFKGNAVIYGMKEWQHYIKEKLEDNTVVVRSPKPTNDGQYNGQKKKDKRRQTTIYKTLH
jgi:hypothetical protein